MVYFSILTVVFSLGVPLAVGHAIGGNRMTAEAALGASLRFCAFLIVPAMVASFLIMRGPLQGLTGSGRIWSMLLLSCVPLPVLGLAVTYCFLAEGALGPLTLVQTIQPAIVTAAAVILFILGTLTVASYIEVTIAAIACTAGAAVVLLGKRPRRGSSLGPLLRYGLRGYAGALASFAAVRADQAVIGPVLGQTQLGLYAVGATIAALPPSLALAVAYRSFGNVASASDDMKPSIIVASVRLCILVAALVAVALAIGSPIVLPVLYGRRFGASLTPLLLLLPGSIALAISGVVASALTVTGRLGRSTAAELTGFGLSVVALPVVVPRWGLVGAACLSTTAYTVTMASYIRSLRVRSLAELLPRRADLAYVTAVIITPFRRLTGRPGK